MANIVGEYGYQHLRDELVVTFEFNLDELYDMLSRYQNDRFSHDIQTAIEEVERRKKVRDEVRSRMPSLSIVVEERSPQ